MQQAKTNWWSGPVINLLLIPVIAAATFVLLDVSVLTGRGIDLTAPGYVWVLTPGFVAIFTVLFPIHALTRLIDRLTNQWLQAAVWMFFTLLIVVLWAPIGVMLKSPMLVGAVIVGGVIASMLIVLFSRLARSFRMAGIILGFLAILAGLALYAANFVVLPRLYFKQHLILQIVSWTMVVFGLNWTLDYRRPLRIGHMAAVFVASFLLLIVFSFSDLPQQARQVLEDPTTATRKALYIAGNMADVDRDGFSPLLNAGDCNAFDPDVHPGAREIPGNRIDDDCLDGDASQAEITRWKDAKIRLQREKTAVKTGLPAVRNVILITLEATRFDVVVRRATAYANILSKGVLFTRAWAVFPATEFSGAGFLGSQWPMSVQSRVINGEQAITNLHALPLPALLSELGFRTAAFVVFYKIADQLGRPMGFRHVWAIPWHKKDTKTTHLVTSAITTDHVKNYLQHIGNHRFFMWIHYLDPHAPYLDDHGRPLPPNRFTRYVHETTRVAGEVEKLLRLLDTLGLSGDTAVIITSDHGEEFGDHGASYHGSSIYQEQTHVPLLVIAPGISAKQCTQSVSLIDLAPTILDLLGLADRIPDTWQGLTLKPWLVKGAKNVKRPIFLEVFSPTDPTRRLNHQVGVVLWPYKLIWHMDTNVFELFNLAADPKETHNLADRAPDILKKLSHLLEIHLASDVRR